MRTFIQRALNKLPKLDKEQIRSLIYDLSSENELLEVVLNSMNDGIMVTDTDNHLIFMNKTVNRFLPIHSTESDDKEIWKIIADTDIAEFIKSVLIKGEKSEDEEFTLDFSGTTRTFKFSILPVVREGTIQGNLILVSEITEKKKRESRLRRAESLASLTTLAAGVAHEIKNPLGSIGIHIQLLQKALKQKGVIDKETGFKYLDIIDEEIQRLNGIVVDFLFAVRPMHADLKLDNISNMLNEFLQFVQYELDGAHVTLETDFDTNLPKIEFDEKYMKQALLNIVKNAVAAMPEGGKLTISTKQEDNNVLIIITDTGIGISEDDITKIFEPYYTTKDFGSGLGLTVVYKIIKEHGGDISVNSKHKSGTTFIISLPIPQEERRLLDWKGEEYEIQHPDSR